MTLSSPQQAAEPRPAENGQSELDKCSCFLKKQAGLDSITSDSDWEIYGTASDFIQGWGGRQ